MAGELVGFWDMGCLGRFGKVCAGQEKLEKICDVQLGLS